MPSQDMVLEPGWMCVVSNPHRCPHRPGGAEPHTLARISQVVIHEGELLVLAVSEDDQSLRALPVGDIVATCPAPREIPATGAEAPGGRGPHGGRRYAHLVPGDRWRPPSPPRPQDGGAQPLGVRCDGDAAGRGTWSDRLSDYGDILQMVAATEGDRRPRQWRRQQAQVQVRRR